VIDTPCGLINGEGPQFECSTYQQDCPEGEKCQPYATEGFQHNATGCFPLAQRPIPEGSSCTVNFDDGLTDLCDVGLSCRDDVCRPLCTCESDGVSEACPDATPVCINPGTAAPVCIPACDPTEADTCPNGQACYYISDIPEENPFICVPDASGPDSGTYGSFCEFVNACDPGLLCVVGTAVPGCNSDECCTAFCDLGEPAASQSCPGFAEGQQCIPFFSAGFAPEGYDHVGFCSIP
jgi:hypothetical protein